MHQQERQLAMQLPLVTTFEYWLPDFVQDKRIIMLVHERTLSHPVVVVVCRIFPTQHEYL